MTILFKDLGLTGELLTALTDLGYEQPTPVQEQAIPVLLAGDDLLAQAQTGTGKTAAFALPILSHIDVKSNKTQALILAPTRELAIQVAEAFQSYAKHLKGFHVAPIYGGQDFRTQLRALSRGSHVVVGTPGRVMDHLRRGTLKLDALKTIVLDEGDEMLNMGFVADIEWILDQIPGKHQVALFSATLPQSIQNVANKYMKSPKKIQIRNKEGHVDAITQYFICVSREQKLEALTRYLEVEDTEGVIIFSRTKTFSAELAEKLQARGYTAAALNGDMNQNAREKVVGKIKSGALDIVVATDVAARGLDVDRITHVINFDAPYDTESYVHRIGRTGRAGRKGTALLFITPREFGLLRDIERATNKTIQKIEPPSIEVMQEKRSKQLSEKITGIIEKSKHLAMHKQTIDKIIAETNADIKDIAAALLHLSQQNAPLPTEEIRSGDRGSDRDSRPPRRDFKRREFGDRNKKKWDPKGPRKSNDRGERAERGPRPERSGDRERSGFQSRTRPSRNRSSGENA